MAGKEIWSWVKSLALAIILALLIRENVLAFYMVDGTSMLPTLNDGQMVAVNKLVYRFGEPDHGDVVVFRDRGAGGGRVLIKRVIAIPGDTVQISEGQVWVNGQQLEEEYITADTEGNLGPLFIEPGFIYVMGDNRNPGMSWDSRAFGPIPLPSVLGRAEFVIFPYPQGID